MSVVPDVVVSSALSRNQLQTRGKTRFAIVPLPLGGFVRIRSLTEREQSDYEATVIAVVNKKQDKDAKIQIKRDSLVETRRRLLALCLVDDNGTRLYGDTQEEIDAVGELDSSDATAIAKACEAHIGADKGYFEELVKNSEAIHVADSQ